jgi:hypothetical protein
MNFILNILGTILSRIFNGSRQKTDNNNKNNENIDISTQNNTAIADATAAIIWICAICLGVFWIVQYIFADYMWIKDCLAHNKMMPFPLDTQKLFEMIYSFLGVGVANAAHKIIRKFIK